MLRLRPGPIPVPSPGNLDFSVTVPGGLRLEKRTDTGQTNIGPFDSTTTRAIGEQIQMNLELINAKKTATKNAASKMAVAVGCGLALFVSTLASDAWARGGSSGGRSMGGMNRYS